jgi:diguanylate cyclase (GGDEF)-like protein
MLPFRTFQSRILFFFVGLFLLAQVLAFLAVDAASRQTARAQINDDLASGGRVFDQLIKDRSERFLNVAQVISGDFGLKTAFGSGDQPTMLSAMKNHMARLKADIMLLVAQDRTLIADTRHPGVRPAKFPYPRLIKAAERTGRAWAMVFFGGRLYQLVVVPLPAPLPVAWVVTGFRIDDTLAQDLKTLTSLDVTFVVEGREDRSPIAAASTLDGDLRQALGKALESAAREPFGNVAFTIKGETYLGLSRDLGGEGDSRVVVFLQRSLDTALQPFYHLRKRLILLFAAGLFVILAGGVLISARVTKPVRMLAESAHSIEQGDYTRVLPVDRQDELGTLTSAFNHMQEAIAEREEQIKRQAYYDALTGLPNRPYLHLKLREAISTAREKNQPLALIMMNIDRFIEVIATLGHAPGNLILQSIGALLRDSAPSALVARVGGDVFALLVPGEDAGGAVRIVQNILKKLEAPFWIKKAPIQIEARFGIAAYPVHGDDADILFRHLDVAVHLAKFSPHGFTVYSPEQDRYNIRHLTLLGELRQAIDHAELMLYYQPKINFLSRRVEGVEALIRWNHSQLGFVSPDEFIRLSEGTGLIKPVTSWALKTAISQCALLNERGINLNMAVNLSARVLPDHQLPDTVASLLDEFQVPPRQITFEITESAIMTDQERTLNTISRLDSTGAQLCVDDFGTGYSSLAYLKSLPVDELKIDKSFVQKMDTNENDAMIVRSIIDLAHNLRFKVTAEGVETQRVWEMLGGRGCDLSQGFLHGTAMPLEELIAWSKTSPWGLGPNDSA